MTSWLVATFGLSPGFASIFVFLLMLAVIAAAIWGLLRLARGLRFGRAKRSRQPRLAVMDITDIDHRRRLVLIRRDHVEHLLLVGGPVDVVVETSILRNAAADLPGHVPAARSAQQIEHDLEAELAFGGATGATPAAAEEPSALPAEEARPLTPAPAAAADPAERADQRPGAMRRGPLPRPVPPAPSETSGSGLASRTARPGEPGAEPRQRRRPGSAADPAAGRPAAAASSAPDAPREAPPPRTMFGSAGKTPAGSRARPMPPRPAAGRPAPSPVEKAAPVQAQADPAELADDLAASLEPEISWPDPQAPSSAPPAKEASAPPPAAPPAAISQPIPPLEEIPGEGTEGEEDDDTLLDLEDEMARLLRGVGGNR